MLCGARLWTRRGASASGAEHTNKKLTSRATRFVGTCAACIAQDTTSSKNATAVVNDYNCESLVSGPLTV